MKKELVLDGLECAVCADTIEEKIKEIDGVIHASMNFETRTLAVEIADGSDMDSVVSYINSSVKNHEPGLKVIERVISKPQKRVN